MFGKFCFRVFVGVLAAALFSGGKAMPVIAMAVICTAGVGLIVVLPAAYLIGLVCTIWFIPYGEGAWSYSEKTKAEGDAPNATRNLPSRAALSEYIASAEAKGQDWETIKADLIRSGWQVETVTNARDIAHGRKIYEY